MTIDGYTQSGASANTLAVGDNAVLTVRINTAWGLGTIFRFAPGSQNSRVQGLAIIDGTARIVVATDGVTIAGNFIGVDADGATAIGNNNGIQIDTGVNNTTIGGTSPADRNLITSVNGGDPIITDGNNTVRGNY